jgi:hypothetical protein
MTDEKAKENMRSLVLDRTPNITGEGSGTKFSVEDQIRHYRELWRCHKALKIKLIDETDLESADQRLQQYEGNPEEWTEDTALLLLSGKAIEYFLSTRTR